MAGTHCLIEPIEEEILRRKLVGVLAVMALAATVALAGSASADGPVPIVYDTQLAKAAPFGGPLDMNGPVVGTLTSTTTSTALNLNVVVNWGQPRSTYRVYMNCGATHATSTCFAQIGTLTVSKTGSGTGNYSIPLATLRCAPFGAGARTDHVDLISSQNVDSSLAAGPIAYTVPAGSCPPAAARTASGDANT